ncbi:MAG: putative dipeptidyl peptidase [Ilumatobacteraceae bacterium]|nr:putative dipeptidyl peptidase [Ilumatobacteraceae bacterium]
MTELTFPRQYARTQRLTLGEPRNLTVSPDGLRVVFCRSAAGDDPVNCLWVLDVASGDERIVADPRRLLSDGDDTELPAEERARRERTREGAGGVVAYATDAAVTVAAFALAGRLFVAGLVSGAARELPVAGPVFDPRPDPLAQRVAYVSGSSLRIGELDGSSWELIGEPESDDGPGTVTWGSAEFIAAEEMGRQRGYWWSPDGTTIAVERSDSAPIATWHIADPAHPEVAPSIHRYPAAGTDNADVSLHVVSLDGSVVDVGWDADAFPYLANVVWTANDALLLTVQSRSQTDVLVLAADPVSGDTSVLFDDHDDQWVDLVAGTPNMLADGRLVMAADRSGARRLLVDDAIVSPEDVQLRSVVAVGTDSVTFLANPLDDPTVQHVWVWTAADGADPASCTSPTADSPGVHTAASGGTVTAIRSSSLDHHGAVTTVGDHVIASNAQTPLVEPNVTIHRVGDDDLAVAVLLPHGDITGPLPVLLDPYGGPHAQRVVSARSAYLSSQWFADQGFAVIVTDGRGTPGRGTEWERAVYHDLAGPVLEDQVRALEAVAKVLQGDGVELDLERVGVRGWSFGGYLAALAVLSRPDVFHAGIAGAPVTEWRLYDTHYTERYLGDPLSDPEPYDVSSLLPLAPQLTRPLLLIHGLADDNVVAAHTLQLSSALLAAGKPHEVLPLSGVTHMTPQEVVAENLLLHQLDFLRRALRIEA